MNVKTLHSSSVRRVAKTTILAEATEVVMNMEQPGNIAALPPEACDQSSQISEG